MKLNFLFFCDLFLQSQLLQIMYLFIYLVRLRNQKRKVKYMIGKNSGAEHRF